jgi:hypothetical protein
MLFVLLLCVGCAVTSKKVPTPAAEITSNQLAQIPKPPDERYFLIFFGSNDLLRQPKHTHTWATLVRVRSSDAGCCGSIVPGCIDPALDVQTISWLPTKVAIDTRNYTVEPGRNFDLHETMKVVYDTNQSVAYWGPYEVWHGFAHRFKVQKDFLDSGVVGYQCVDTRGEAARLGNGCDCIHAVTDMDPVYPRWRYPLAVYGKAATANLVRRFMKSPVWIDPPTTHAWLLPRLGLDAYPLRERKYIGFSEEHDGRSDLDVKSAPIPSPMAEPKKTPLKGYPDKKP